MDSSTPDKKQNFFDMIQSKTAFWMGFGTAILTLGTLGFIIMGTCMLRGTCSIGSSANTNGNVVNTLPSGDGQAPGPSAAVPAVTKDDHIRGNKNAKITLVEYSDFECSFCASFHPTLVKVLEKYKDQVRWVYRHYPLSFHPNAEPAALASECAGEQGKFWEFADLAFANQSSLGDAFYTKFAQDNRLNMKKFNDCVSSKKYLSKVQDQMATGGAAGVDGTPGTFIISEDGTATPLKGALPFEAVVAEIEKLLK